MRNGTHFDSVPPMSMTCRGDVRRTAILAIITMAMLTCGRLDYAAPESAARAVKPPAVHTSMPPAHASISSGHHASPDSRNPHLHGFAAHEDAHRHTDLHHADEHHVVDEHHADVHHADEHHAVEHHADEHYIHDHRWWAHHWYYEGDYATWYVAHTGFGTIEGMVSAQSAPVSGAMVVLRKPGGRIFRRKSFKHLTHTDSYGHFKMRGVRAGNFRIVAKLGSASSHEQIHVEPGVTSRTQLEI